MICAATQVRPIRSEAASTAAAEGAKTMPKQGDDGHRETGCDEAAVLHHVAERRDEDEAEAIADLREGDEQADGGRGHRHLAPMTPAIGCA